MMEKKFKFKNTPMLRKVIYGTVITILVVTAIVIGIVSAASKAPEAPNTDNPPITDGTDGSGNEQPGNNEENEENKPLAFIAPTVGTVAKEHSLTTPVFSLTLGEWRMHTGIDISCEEGASVYASEDGVVSGIYQDPLLGFTVEITHKNDLKTRYSNLASEGSSTLKVGDNVKSGEKIGTVGDTSVSELAEEPHLHFEVILKDVKVNPMDYIVEESKKSSLGITE